MTSGKMSEKEYLERLGGLFEKLRNELPHASDEAIFSTYRDREFDLTIDFRLGTDFPDKRRQALKKLQCQALCRMGELKSSLASGRMEVTNFAEAMQQLVSQMSADFSELLDEDEMQALCGDGLPGIPLDPNMIGRSS